MNCVDFLDVIIFILLSILCICIFILEILYLNHIMYDSYTTFVIAIQFNKNKRKNVINIDQNNNNNFSITLNRKRFKAYRVSKTTIRIRHELSKLSFFLTTSDTVESKMKIQILNNETIKISKDLICLHASHGYFIISNRFNM